MGELRWSYREDCPPQYQRPGQPTFRLWEADFASMQLTIRFGANETVSELRRIDAGRWETRLLPMSHRTAAEAVRAATPPIMTEHTEKLIANIIGDEAGWRPVIEPIASLIEAAFQRSK